jgi:hypothetical protein
MGQQQGEEFQATGPEGGVALELGFAQGLQVGGGWAKRGEFRRQEDGAGLGDEQRPQRRDLRERHLRGGGAERHHPHLPGQGELDVANLADEQPAQGRDLRERPLRGGGHIRHHPHLPLNRKSPHPYPAPSPMGRGSLTRGPAGVGAPADLAGTRPLVGGASHPHKSAPSRRWPPITPKPPAGGRGDKGGPFGIRASLRPGDSTA